MADSSVIQGIKKERLSKHLDDVDKLLRLYHQELDAPLPFRATEDELWPAVYRPKVEQDNNANHMLRKHIVSRAFWKHHSDWGKELEGICRAGGSLLEFIETFQDQLFKKTGLRPTSLFGRTAAEDAFKESLGIEVHGRYEACQDHGVNYRGLRIEESSDQNVQESSDQNDVQTIQEAHSNLVAMLKRAPTMREIDRRWKEAKGHSESMGQLLNGVLLASDIVYPCRFCRSFFKG